MAFTVAAIVIVIIILTLIALAGGALVSTLVSGSLDWRVIIRIALYSVSAIVIILIVFVFACKLLAT